MARCTCLSKLLPCRTHLPQTYGDSVPGASPTGPQKHCGHLTDPDVSVRLAAAFAVARRGKADVARPVFAAALAPNKSPEVRLESLHYLTNLCHRPSFFRPLLEAAAKSTAPADNYSARAAAFLLAQ